MVSGSSSSSEGTRSPVKIFGNIFISFIGAGVLGKLFDYRKDRFEFRYNYWRPFFAERLLSEFRMISPPGRRAKFTKKNSAIIIAEFKRNVTIWLCLKLYKGLPHAFKEAGVLEGICVLIFTGFLSFRGMMLLIKAKQYVSKDNISRIKLTPVNSADEDQVQLLEKVLLYSNSYYFKL